MEKRITKGLIMLRNKLGIEYKISEIEYTIYEDESFEYIFTPFYHVIDLLTPEIFQGIPGLDLDLRKSRYCRKNIVPVFISERTPGPNRENLQELLAEAGMDHLNRLEWLIKTDYVYSGDSFYVAGYSNEYNTDFMLQTGLSSVGSGKYAEEILSAIAHGQRIIIDGKCLSKEEVSILHTVLSDLLLSNRQMQKKNRQYGIEKAAAKGLYRGRKKIQLDDIRYEVVKEQLHSGEISVAEAVSELGISRATLYRRLKDD